MFNLYYCYYCYYYHVCAICLPLFNTTDICGMLIPVAKQYVCLPLSLLLYGLHFWLCALCMSTETRNPYPLPPHLNGGGGVTLCLFNMSLEIRSSPF